MAKIKNARSGEYIISCSAKGAIKVAKDYDNDKGALREIAESIGFEYDTNWGTRQFGKNLIQHITGEHVGTNEEAQAESGEYIIFKEASGTIQVFKDFDNVKKALREISDKIGYKYDTKWTTRQFGNKLINYINGDQEEEVAQEADTEIKEEGFTIIQKVQSSFIVENDDDTYYDADCDDADEFISKLESISTDEEIEIMKTHLFSDSAALISYLDEDPDDIDLAYKLITAAYMVYMGYCADDEFYADETTYYLNDCQELHYERSTDIDFG